MVFHFHYFVAPIGTVLNLVQYYRTKNFSTKFSTVAMTGRKSMHSARGARARVSVNFRKFSPCIARSRRARSNLTVYPPSRTLEALAFDDYCRFDTSGFF